MRPKFEVIDDPEKSKAYIAADYAFYCPGCKMYHGVWTTNKNSNSAIWQFNGDIYNPTVSPSILVTFANKKGNLRTCHSFITNGHIQFLSDCHHELRDQTVPLPEIE